jgi:hypothetical protein
LLKDLFLNSDFSNKITYAVRHTFRSNTILDTKPERGRGRVPGVKKGLKSVKYCLNGLLYVNFLFYFCLL